MAKPLEDRFWAKVNKTDNCWVWTASRNAGGYGTLGGGGRRGKTLLAHRFSYEHHAGLPIPAGLDVLHRCDNPPCVRPDHLFLGTDADNVLDCKTKGRLSDRSGERNGRAKLTAEQVLEIRAAYIPRENGSELVKKYGLSTQQFHNIISRRAWARI